MERALAVFKENNVLYEENIPQDFKEKKQFVVWKATEQRDSKGKIKVSKIPYDPNTGKKAKANDSSTWGSYKDAQQAYEKGGYDGIGFELLLDNIVGIDLDDCIDGNGNVEPWAKKIINSLDSYTEISPSGRGIRIFLYGKLPPDGRKKGNVEMYMDSRFLTLTGNHIKETPLTVEDRSDEIMKLHNEVWPPSYEKSEQNAPINKALFSKKEIGDVNLSDIEIIEKAKNAKNGDKFISLYNGEFDAYPSQSEADLALCSLITFYSREYTTIDKIFRTSGLFRPKWDTKHHSNGDTYGAGTIKKALRDVTKSYEPKQATIVDIDSHKKKKRPSNYYFKTDLGNGARFRDAYENKFIYCPENKRWYEYNGKYWAPDKLRAVFSAGKNLVKKMYAEAPSIENDDERNAFIKHVIKSQSDNKIRSMLSMAESEMPVLLTDFDREPWKINCQNGTLDLKTMELQPHRETDLATRCCNCDYIPGAESEVWNCFLESVIPDADTRLFLQKCAGYTLAGVTSEEILLFLYGPPATGKSTFLAAIFAALGSYSTVLDFESLVISNRSGAARNDIAKTHGARFVQSLEVDEGKRLAEALVNSLTGGDTITARFLYGEEFDFTPAFTLWLAANNRPQVRGGESGIWRRIRQIPFNQQVPEDRRDPELKEKLKEKNGEHQKAVMAWAVEGYKLWRLEGLKAPDLVVDTTEEYRRASDQIQDFLDERCVAGVNYHVENSELYEAYKVYCSDTGTKYLSQKKFSQKLMDKGLDKKHSGKKYWDGITLRRMEQRDLDT